MVSATDCTWRSLARSATALAVAISFAGCFAIADLDRFEPREDAFVLHLKNMTPHVTQLIGVRLVSSNNLIQARAIVVPLGGTDATIVMPGATTGGVAWRTDFFADGNANGNYDPPTMEAGGTLTFGDHSWSVPIPENGELTFCHSTDFTDLNTTGASAVGSAFAMRIVGLDSFVGRMLEVRVIEPTLKRTVGLFRWTSIPGATANIAIPGIIDTGTTYDVDFFIDVNGDGGYTAGVDPSWRKTLTDNRGIDITFDARAGDADLRDIQFEAPGTFGTGNSCR